MSNSTSTKNKKTTDTTKQKKPWTDRNSPIINQENWESDDEKKEIIRKTLSQSLLYFKRPIVKNDDEAIQRVDEYFHDCARLGTRPVVEELSLVLGCTKSTVNDWESGHNAKISSFVIKRTKELIAAFDAKLVSEGKLNPVAYIFRAKNYYGMADKQEVVLTPNNQDVPTETLLAEADLLPGD